MLRLRHFFVRFRVTRPSEGGIEMRLRSDDRKFSKRKSCRLDVPPRSHSSLNVNIVFLEESAIFDKLHGKLRFLCATPLSSLFANYAEHSCSCRVPARVMSPLHFVFCFGCCFFFFFFFRARNFRVSQRVKVEGEGQSCCS